jgi:hypothetical protein
MTLYFASSWARRTNEALPQTVEHVVILSETQTV